MSSEPCTHDHRFRCVSDLPVECNGCLACYADELERKEKRAWAMVREMFDLCDITVVDIRNEYRLATIRKAAYDRQHRRTDD